MRTPKSFLIGTLSLVVLAGTPLAAHAGTRNHQTATVSHVAPNNHRGTYSGGNRGNYAGYNGGDRGRYRHYRGGYSSFYFGSGFGFGYPYGYGYGSGYGYGYPYGYSGYGSPYGYGGGYGSYGNGYGRSIVRGEAVGSRGSLGAEVQQRLAQEGYYRGAIDGVVGSGTHRAIRAYERAHGLPADGEIDRRLLRVLGLS